MNRQIEVFNRALIRNLFELERALSYRNALKKLKEIAPTTNWSFFSYAYLAFWDSMFLHLMKILDQHKSTGSFFYLHRCEKKKIEETLHKYNLTIADIVEFSDKLKIIRDKTHFHIDKKRIFNPNSIWEEADISGNYLNNIADNLWNSLNDLYKLQFEKQFDQYFYEGEDIKGIIKLCLSNNLNV